MKYDKKIVKQICELVSTDSYTIQEICKAVGIAKTTYHEWDKKPDFSNCIKKAKNDFKKLIAAEAKKSLMKKIQGYMEQEKKTITVDTGKRDGEGKPIVRVKEHVVAEKYFPPDTAAIIFALTNSEPEEWKNRFNSEVTGKDGKDLITNPPPSKVVVEFVDFSNE